MIKLFESTDINAFSKFYRIVKKKNQVSKENIFKFIITSKSKMFDKRFYFG